VRVLARLLLVGTIVSGALTIVTIGAGPAGACSCLGVDDVGALDQSAVAFIGTALPVPPEIQYPHATHPGGAPDYLADRTLRFRVEHVFKGDVAPEQEVVTPGQGPACGIAVDVGTRYLVFGTSPDAEPGTVALVTPEAGQYASYSCSGTREARLDERPAGYPEGTSLVRSAPQQGRPEPVLPESSTTEWYVLPVVLGALVLAIAVAAVVALRKRS
jgi:hypothetical protein